MLSIYKGLFHLNKFQVSRKQKSPFHSMFIFSSTSYIQFGRIDSISFGSFGLIEIGKSI